MQLSDLVHQSGEWLRGLGTDSDIVISTRIRLARNVAGYPFVSRLKPEQQAGLSQRLCESIVDDTVVPDCHYFDLKAASEIERRLLVERHLISKEHEDAAGDRGVAIRVNEAVSIMVNEEDHLRIQVLHCGFELAETWRLTNEVDTALGDRVPYAYSERLGYLTACPTNVGTGMRASVMLHLPALELTKQIEKVFHAVAKINLIVRGLYGEGTQASGNLYQISNQISLGKTEEEILAEIQGIIPEIVENERRARQFLLDRNRQQIEDRVWRAYGMLRHARIISSGETIALLSHLRLGVHLALLSNLDISAVNQLFVRTLPAHLQVLEGRELGPQVRDVARATYIRECLAQAGHTGDQ
ncbi:MAG TPA: protein arginine kinase [Planctomycetota bacterium]|nr:protein arginine kinase [Planctomycetota bacterium]